MLCLLASLGHRPFDRPPSTQIESGRRLSNNIETNDARFAHCCGCSQSWDHQGLHAFLSRNVYVTSMCILMKFQRKPRLIFKFRISHTRILRRCGCSDRMSKSSVLKSKPETVHHHRSSRKRHVPHELRPPTALALAFVLTCALQPLGAQTDCVGPSKHPSRGPAKGCDRPL